MPLEQGKEEGLENQSIPSQDPLESSIQLLQEQVEIPNSELTEVKGQYFKTLWQTQMKEQTEQSYISLKHLLDGIIGIFY